MGALSYNGDRVQEKHLHREEDRRVLKSGQKSAAELRAENGFFARDAAIDWANSKP